MVYKSVALFSGSADQCGPKCLMIQGFQILLISIWQDSDNTTQKQTYISTHILGSIWNHDPNVQRTADRTSLWLCSHRDWCKGPCVYSLIYNAHIKWSNRSLLTERQVSLGPCHLIYLEYYLCSSLQNKHNPHPNNKNDNYLLQKWHRNILCVWYSAIICFPWWLHRPVPFV